MRILKWLGMAAAALVVIAAGAYALRTNPMGPVAGRELSGELITDPVDDWSFTDEHQLIAVETRPAAPHSVTTVCVALDGKLYVPAQGGSAKSWTHYAVSDPRARVKIDGKVYPVVATRVREPAVLESLMAVAKTKYEFDSDDSVPEDIWVFRMDSVETESVPESPASG